MSYSIPVQMNVAEIVREDDHFTIAAAQRPVPIPKSGEVLIAVHAAGVNGHDVHQMHRGGHPVMPEETDLPGLEVAGEIVAIGDSVCRWRVGDRVCALLRGGGYAEYALAPAGNCLPIPGELSYEQAAVLPETMFTVWSNVFVDMALSPGETFLMNGGTSGIGVAAIQMASALGHQVFATARGPEKVALCRKLGATRAIDYETEDFATVIPAETGGRGVDVILEIVGGDYIAKDLEVLANGGRMVMIGAARGLNLQLDLSPIVRKRLKLAGSLLRPRPDAFKAEVAGALESRIWPLVAGGQIDPMLDRTFPLDQARDAVGWLDQRRQIGKIALLTKLHAEKG